MLSSLGIAQTSLPSPGSAPPPASRVKSPGWRDPRLWLGVALVAVSVVVGAKLVGGADDTVAMWSVASDIAAGDTVERADLVLTRVQFADEGDAARYFAAEEPLPAEPHLVRGLGAGELLPRAAFGAPTTGTSQVSVSVPVSQVPPSVRSGSVVDLWVVPAAGESGRAKLAVGEVVVLEAPRSAADFGAAGGEQQLVLSIPDDAADLAKVVTASGTGRLMVVGRG